MRKALYLDFCCSWPSYFLVRNEYVIRSFIFDYINLYVTGDITFIKVYFAIICKTLCGYFDIKQKLRYILYLHVSLLSTYVIYSK